MQFLEGEALALPEELSGAANLNLFLSGSNRLAAAVGDQSLVYILSTANHSQPHHRIQSQNVSDIIFALDDSYIILNCQSAIKNYSLSSSAWTADLFPPHPSNLFTAISITPDYARLLVLNNSILYSRLFSSNRWESVQLPNLCRGRLLPDLDRLYTVSEECSVCLFLPADWSVPAKTKSFPHCRAGQMLRQSESRLALISDSVMQDAAALLLLDSSTLELVDTYNFTQFPLKVVRFQNYLIAYQPEAAQTLIFRNNFTAAPSLNSFSPSSVADILPAPLLNSLFFLLLSPLQLRSFHLGAKCGGSSEVSASCPCSKGSVFQLSSGECVQKECSSSSCGCPRYFSLSEFWQECRLNCSLLYGSSDLLPFGDPQECYCVAPLSWNRQVGDCSLIDCRNVPHAGSLTPAPSCACDPNFQWNSSSFACEEVVQVRPGGESESSSSVVGVVAGSILGVLVLVVLLVIYCAKRGREQTEQPQTPYVPYDMRKALEQLPTHRHLDQDQPSDPAAPKKKKRRQKPSPSSP